MLYTIWVGGTEVNDYYFDSIIEAREYARDYTDQGYKGVHVEALKLEEAIDRNKQVIKKERK